MPQALWSPSVERINQSLMHRFQQFVELQINRKFVSYRDFHGWSIHETGLFWDLLAQFVGIAWMSAPKTSQKTLRPGMLGTEWFPGGTLNFAANLLPNPDDRVVLVAYAEGAERRGFTARMLWNAVARCAAGLRNQGVVEGDRVAGVLSNGYEAVVGMLATASLGAVWSSCSPDFGANGVFDRLNQIAPKVIFATRQYHYQGKVIDSSKGILSAVERMKFAPYVVFCDHIDATTDEFVAFCGGWNHLDHGQETIDFVPRKFSDPQYILFSSGTTGLPKCIVHSVGGTLLQHKKELMLHSDIQPKDVLLYFTTCGWMMWNWMVSALGCGATVVTFDGSPQGSRLWDLVAEERVTHFGTSPKFISTCMSAEDDSPLASGDLSCLKAILSTGSPLLPAHCEWIYRWLPDVHLASISGGTDIVSCFMLGNPTIPVYAGEIQCAGLGMAIEAWDDHGKPVRGQKAELVCVKPFVAMPVGFWNDPDGTKYRQAYFGYFKGRDVWRHGDFVEITERGGVIVYGRSDATLNPGGVRIGTAEIYRCVEGLPQIADSIAIGQVWNGDTRVVLFVKMAVGYTWSDSCASELKVKIRSELSPRHVPAVVLPVADIPYTRSGKKVEVAVTQIIHDEAVPNRSALVNPESLELFVALKSSLR